MQAPVHHTGQVGMIESDDGAAIRALMFDLGGVLIEVDFGRVLRAWAAVAGCDPLVLGQRFTFDEAYWQHERGELDASGYFASLRSSLGLGLSDQEFAAGWNDLFVGIAGGMPALLGAASRRYPLYAFTNSNPTHQCEWSARFAAELSVFRTVFVSSGLGLRKPDPAAFAAVARRAGLQAREILFFDDTPENIAGARAAGMPAVLARSAPPSISWASTPRRPARRDHPHKPCCRIAAVAEPLSGPPDAERMKGFATARLSSAPVTVADLRFLLALWADPQVAATLGGPRSAGQTERILREDIRHWLTHGFGRWILRRDGTPVGHVKLARCHLRGRAETELGYALLPSAQGHGYATEAGAGALTFARETAGLAEVVAFALESNTPSFAVMHRLGFRPEARLDLPAGPHRLYRKTLTEQPSQA